MSYRVEKYLTRVSIEVASSGRAGCQATDCKKAGNKIPKNELRLGTWVDIPNRGGSWRWRHWGCVTGKILLNIRQLLDPSESGDYAWDVLDGYQGDDKNSLEHYPALQTKIRRVITQGFIDPDDFKGDPEMNKLGCSGLRAPVSKKKKDLETSHDNLNIDELKQQLNTLAAERNSILKNGGSISKIDAQLEIVQQALIKIEKTKPPNKNKPAAKKSSSNKRCRMDDSSDNENPEENLDISPRKKRISAKDRIKMEAESRRIKDEEDKTKDEESKKKVEIPARKKRISAKDRIKMDADNRRIKDEEDKTKDEESEEKVEIPARKKRISAKDRIKMEAESRKIKDKENKTTDEEFNASKPADSQKKSSKGFLKEEEPENFSNLNKDKPTTRENSRTKRNIKEEDQETRGSKDGEDEFSSAAEIQDKNEVKEEKKSNSNIPYEESRTASIKKDDDNEDFQQVNEDNAPCRKSAPKRKTRSKNSTKTNN